MAPINERSRANQGALDEEALITGLVPVWADSSDPWCVVDRLGRIRWSNAALRELLGAGKTIQPDLLLRRTSPQARKHLRSVLQRGPCGEALRIPLRMPEQQHAELEIRAATLGPRHTVLTLRPAQPEAEHPDRTRIKELEGALAAIGTTLATLGIGSPVTSDGRHELPLDLTGRQREVAELLLAGMREAEIADALYISQHTVRNHKKAAFRRLDVHSMTELLSTFRPTLRASA